MQLEKQLKTLSAIGLTVAALLVVSFIGCGGSDRVGVAPPPRDEANVPPQAREKTDQEDFERKRDVMLKLEDPTKVLRAIRQIGGKYVDLAGQESIDALQPLADQEDNAEISAAAKEAIANIKEKHGL